MVSCLLLLAWYTAITDYQIISNNSNSQQATTSYRQASINASQQTKMKTTTNRLWMWQFKYANTMYIYCSIHDQWFNLWLYHWHSLWFVDKTSVTSLFIWNLPQSIAFYEYHLIYYMPIIWHLYIPPIIHNLHYSWLRISMCCLTIKVHCRNQPNKNKLVLYKLLVSL